MSDQTPVCPECGYAHIEARPRDGAKWYCWNCGARFDDPDYGERDPIGPRSGLARELADADSIEELRGD